VGNFRVRRLGEPLLALEGVRKRYTRGDTEQRTVLADVSLTVSAGEIVAVDADRRAGKSTLLRVVAGIEEADEGSIFFAGRALSAEKRHALLGSQVGWVDRRGPGMPWRVLDYVSLPLTMNAGRRALARARERGIAALDRVGAAHCAAQQWDELADYERLLVSLARVYAHRPRLIVADDLFDDLRVRGQVELGDLLSAIVRELGCGVLASVCGGENALIADRVLLMRGGRLLVMSDRSVHGEGNVVSFPARQSSAGERA